MKISKYLESNGLIGAHKGHKVSKEQKEKQSATMKRYWLIRNIKFDKDNKENK